MKDAPGAADLPHMTAEEVVKSASQKRRKERGRGGTGAADRRRNGAAGV